MGRIMMYATQISALVFFMGYLAMIETPLVAIACLAAAAFFALWYESIRVVVEHDRA